MTTCLPQPNLISTDINPHAIEPLLPPPPPRFAPTPVKSFREGPSWLEKFLSCTYFDPCAEHHFNKNEKNHFCIDCIDGPLCSRGLLAAHAKHRTLQVRKASHADGVRVENVCKLLDISSIQTYIINNHKIVFLLRQAKGKMAAKPVDGTVAARHCQTCGRLLSDLVKFCSIKCKLLGVQHQQEIGATTTLSLSPEVRPSVPSRGNFRCIFDNLQHASPNYASDHPYVAPSQVRDFEEYRRKRELEVAQLSMSMEYDNIRMSSLVSPVSVLHSLMPYALDNAATQLASMENMQARVCGKSLNGVQKHDGLEDQWAMQDDSNAEKSMRLEVVLIHKLFQLASRRKRRKCLPHRAPLC